MGSMVWSAMQQDDQEGEATTWMAVKVGSHVYYCCGLLPVQLARSGQSRANTQLAVKSWTVVYAGIAGPWLCLNLPLCAFNCLLGNRIPYGYGKQGPGLFSRPRFSAARVVMLQTLV